MNSGKTRPRGGHRRGTRMKVFLPRPAAGALLSRPIATQEPLIGARVQSQRGFGPQVPEQRVHKDGVGALAPDTATTPPPSARRHHVQRHGRQRHGRAGRPPAVVPVPRVRRGAVGLRVLLRGQGAQPGGRGAGQRAGHLEDRQRAQRRDHVRRLHPQPGGAGRVLLPHDAGGHGEPAAAGRPAGLVPAEVLLRAQGPGAAVPGESWY